MPRDSHNHRFLTSPTRDGDRARGSSQHCRPVLAAAAIAASSVLGASATASAHPMSDKRAQSHYAVGVTRCTFIDSTRTVLNYATKPPSTLAGRRVLVTDLRYPTATAVANTVEQIDAPPATRLGGFPLIVFAHGYDVVPATYAAMLDYWVRRGFVVASPIFPDENRDAVALQRGANTEADLVNEPADLAFVTHQLLANSAVAASNCPLAFGLINPSALALAGHSDGAVAVGMLTNSTGRDPQGVTYRALRYGLSFRAAIIMSGDEGGRAAYQTSPTSPALLVVQSAVDQCNLASGAVRLYRDINQIDKWFLELLRAHHLPPFDGADTAAFEVVTSTTTQFLQMNLEATSSAARLMAVGTSSPGVAKFFHAGSGPSIKPPTIRFCGLT